MPDAKVTEPAEMVRFSVSVKLPSVMTYGPVPANSTPPRSEPFAYSEAALLLVNLISDVLCVTVPPVLLKSPPTTKTPDGNVSDPAPMVTEPVEVAFTSVIFQAPLPVNCISAKSELPPCTTFPEPAPSNTISEPLFVKAPPLLVKVPLMVVVPVGSVTTPAVINTSCASNVVSVKAQLPEPVKATL